MLNKPVLQRGFGLIELMVAITLVAIVLALGMPSLVAGNQSRQIRSAAESIQAGLQYARSEALRRNRVVKFELRPQNGWTVGCDPADPTVDNGQVVCPAVLQTREGSEGSAKAEVALDEVTAGTTTTTSGTVLFTGTISFTPLGRVTAPVGGAGGTLGAGNIAMFTVTNPSAGACTADGGEMRCLRVLVTAGGLVRMCDPAVTAGGDPRRCNEVLPAP